METLSVNYYNLYLKKHSEELQVLFADERPVGKYTLYKKLNRAKISVDRKYGLSKLGPRRLSV